ncbi:hypothetical protein HJ590_10635 [Naumannella sp. ID2617S]|uniref:Uncharacterized protein n=1 Tax=Enemella dayhoffiae TaxID=2016507 RepID=A0A255HDU3_9ACTN|nr:hypothetical protein [Enemella dayhoffiae]NNG20021.1 hypothetical protein [Naumannella sp. ID2617S]OYO25233.1 hypothetical protein CGZ93_01930 [Enemella dayhoffiae]
MSNSDYYHLIVQGQQHRELVERAAEERLARQIAGPGWLSRLKNLVGGHGERPPARRPANRPVGVR